MFGNSAQNSSSKIDPEVLIALNLTPEEIDQYNTEREEMQNFAQEMESQGRDFYQMAQNNQGHLTVNIGRFSFMSDTPEIEMVPGEMLKEWNQEKNGRLPQDVQKIEAGLRAFIIGFGKQALDKKDWKTAINAFDLITPGGIIQNKETVRILGDKSKFDKPTRILIAQKIQEKLNQRKTQDSPKPNIPPVPPPPVIGNPPTQTPTEPVTEINVPQ